jgi:hypothetical protein
MIAEGKTLRLLASARVFLKLLLYPRTFQANLWKSANIEECSNQGRQSEIWLYDLKYFQHSLNGSDSIHSRIHDSVLNKAQYKIKCHQCTQ